MKVTGTPPHIRIPRATADQSKPGRTLQSVPHASVSTRLSPTGRSLALVRSPEVPDEARIERLRALVDSGRLEIDAVAIADAMLREER